MDSKTILVQELEGLTGFLDGQIEKVNAPENQEKSRILDTVEKLISMQDKYFFGLFRHDLELNQIRLMVDKHTLEYKELLDLNLLSTLENQCSIIQYKLTNIDEFNQCINEIFLIIIANATEKEEYKYRKRQKLID